MDYSTASEKTSNITHSDEDIIDKYSNLKIQHETLSKQYETLLQESHDIKRQYQVALDVKADLTSELEYLQKNENKMKAEWMQKIQLLHDEIEIVKEEKRKEVETHIRTIESLEAKVSKLEQIPVNDAITEKTYDPLENTKVCEEMRLYEEEIMKLKEINGEQKKAITEIKQMYDAQKEHFEITKEELDCLKSNLANKKEELNSITEMLHSAQEDLALATSELQQFKSQTNSHALKGNSLFAEVDDKRQEMLKSLSQMKEKVHQLNRELLNKQAEVDSLLCEKKTLWEAYSEQSVHHDANLIRAYERRIADLEIQTDQHQREIAQWYSINLNPESSEAAQWLSGVMDYYKKENGRLNCELRATSVDNLSKEQKIRELHRQLITWRTKASEASAALSELETKLKMATKPSKEDETIMIKHENDTFFNITTKTEDIVPVVLQDITESFITDFRPINASAIKDLNDSRRKASKESVVKPGILVTGSSNENKTVKKTSFK